MGQEHFELCEPHEIINRLVHDEACEPSLSLFLPIQRRAAQAHRNRVVFRNLIKDAARIMQFRGVEPKTAEDMIGRLESLAGDESLWTLPAEGLAVFLSPSSCHIAPWPMALDEAVFVDRRFHILPFLAQEQEIGLFYHLALTHDVAHLTHGNRLGWEDVPLQMKNASFREYLSRFEPEERYNLSSRASQPHAQAHRREGAASLSQGKLSNLHDAHLDDYLREVAAAVFSCVSDHDIPLVLSGDETMMGRFHKIFDKKHKGPILIAHHANILNESEAHRQVVALLAPTFEAPLKNALAQRDEIGGSGSVRISSGIESVVRAARAGIVDTLFVPGKKSEAFGYFWPERDEVRLGFVPESRSSEDLMNTAAIFTLRHGGRVFTLSSDLPRLGVAQAILRYAA